MASGTSGPLQPFREEVKTGDLVARESVPCATPRTTSCYWMDPESCPFFSMAPYPPNPEPSSPDQPGWTSVSPSKGHKGSFRNSHYQVLAHYQHPTPPLASPGSISTKVYIPRLPFQGPNNLHSGALSAACSMTSHPCPCPALSTPYLCS